MVRRWQLIQQVAEEEEDEGVVIVAEEGEEGYVVAVAVVVGEDVGTVESVVRFTPLTLWRRNANVEKILEAWDTGGHVMATRSYRVIGGGEHLRNRARAYALGLPMLASPLSI